MSRLIGGVYLVGAVLSFCTQLSAQEFRVYTRVYDVSSATNQTEKLDSSTIIARSLTLFHAGKVYDYIDTIGEVVVFEPAHNRFTILNGSRMMATTVDFDEIKHLIKITKQETENYVKQLEEQGDPKASLAIQPLRFQLNPEFDTYYDKQRESLTLSSRFFRYDVQCADVKKPEAIESYLRYADWTARLNSVLHPYALLPGPRLLLNKSLRERQRMPVEVALRADLENQIHLRARHQIHWKLGAKDRSQIHHWETLLKHKDLREVTFHEYQRAVLVSRSN